MSVINKLKKNSTIKEAAELESSKFFEDKPYTQTPVPMLNVALSGKLDGGLSPGITVFAGESKRFKSLYSLLLASCYMKQYPKSALLFYDSEFGTPKAYFDGFGIDKSRVLHSPIMNIEELKFDIMQQLEGLERNERVVIVIDSIGNVASKKEVEDAINAKSVADMSRAKAMKSLFRMVTPYTHTRNIPLICVAHTYKTQEKYSKDVVSSGSGIYYAADNIYIVGRRQEKDGTDVTGYHFILRAEKSRAIKEGSKIPISVSFEGGIMKYSGLLDVALEGGFVLKPKNGWYRRACDPDDVPNVRAKVTATGEFWKPILENKEFYDFVKNKYSTEGRALIHESHDNEEADDEEV